MKGKLIIISVMLAVLITACSEGTCDSNGKEVEFEFDKEAYNDSIRKLVEESRKLEKEYIAKKEWYEMPVGGFMDEVTEQDIQRWKKQMQALREENGFIIPIALFDGDLQCQLMLADFFNYLYTFSIHKPLDVDYKLIRYYADLAFPNTEGCNDNEFTRTSWMCFQLDKMAYFLQLPHGTYADEIEDFYQLNEKWNNRMYNEILRDATIRDYCINKYKRSISNKPLQRKELELFEKHIEMIDNFKYTNDDFECIRYTMASQSDRGLLYSNYLRDIAYTDYYLLNLSFPRLRNECERIPSVEINDALDNLKADMFRYYEESDIILDTRQDDVRFIDYYKESLNKWLDAREKVLETLDGEEKQNFLRADNYIRYFCMMHIKNAFQFYIPENDDYYDAWFVSSIYNFQTPEDSVRYGRNWFQKSIDLEKY